MLQPEHYQGAIETLTHWGRKVAGAPEYLTSGTGSAVLALLCNVGAKRAPQLYSHKAPLVTLACEMAPTGSWWVDKHEGSLVWLLQVPFWRQALQLTVFEQFTFHFPEGTTLPGTPRPAANGRHWSGIPTAHRASSLADLWERSVGVQ